MGKINWTTLVNVYFYYPPFFASIYPTIFLSLYLNVRSNQIKSKGKTLHETQISAILHTNCVQHNKLNRLINKKNISFYQNTRMSSPPRYICPPKNVSFFFLFKKKSIPNGIRTIYIQTPTTYISYVGHEQTAQHDNILFF